MVVDRLAHILIKYEWQKYPGIKKFAQKMMKRTGYALSPSIYFRIRNPKPTPSLTFMHSFLYSFSESYGMITTEAACSLRRGCLKV